MSIGPHKALGWGLACDENEKLADPRLDSESPLLCPELKEPRVSDFIAWLEEAGRDADALLASSLQHHIEEHGGPPLSDCVRCGLDDEGGWLVLRPTGAPGWFRSEDAIDWLEETGNGSRPQHELPSRCEVLRFAPPYPYRRRMMDAETGCELDRALADRRLAWNGACGCSAERSPELLEQVARAAGYASLAEAAERIVPAVPHEIRRLAGYGRLFRGERTLLSLRPALRTWWG